MDKYIDFDGTELEVHYYYPGLYEYRYKGLLHRLDGPAMEWVDGGYLWWKNGIAHRIGGPANHYISYYVNGKLVQVYYIYG